MTSTRLTVKYSKGPLDKRNTVKYLPGNFFSNSKPDTLDIDVCHLDNNLHTFVNKRYDTRASKKEEQWDA